jgi:hypothetical protein
MNKQPYKSESLKQTFTPMFEYKGYTIYKGDNPMYYDKGHTYVDHDGTPSNKNVPLFYSEVIKNKRTKPERNLYVSMFGGDKLGDTHLSDMEYTKKMIDRHDELRREQILKEWDNRNNTLHYTYECNNVIINVLQNLNDRIDTQIYVNERSLRNAHLPKNFTFNDILEQVYINTISKYNTTAFSKLNTKIYKNKKVEKIDLTILPVYEFLGLEVDYKGKKFIPHNVFFSSAYDDKFVFETKDDKVLISVEEIKDLELKEVEMPSIYALSVLKNKYKFYE